MDDDLGEKFLEGEDPTVEELMAAIRRATHANKFVPIFMGSAYKNKGVQLLLDGVDHYLPAPLEVPNTALDLEDNEAPLDLGGSPGALLAPPPMCLRGKYPRKVGSRLLRLY